MGLSWVSHWQCIYSKNLINANVTIRFQDMNNMTQFVCVSSLRTPCAMSQSSFASIFGCKVKGIFWAFIQVDVIEERKIINVCWTSSTYQWTRGNGRFRFSSLYGWHMGPFNTDARARSSKVLWSPFVTFLKISVRSEATTRCLVCDYQKPSLVNNPGLKEP